MGSLGLDCPLASILLPPSLPVGLGVHLHARPRGGWRGQRATSQAVLCGGRVLPAQPGKETSANYSTSSILQEQQCLRAEQQPGQPAELHGSRSSRSEEVVAGQMPMRGGRGPAAWRRVLRSTLVSPFPASPFSSAFFSLPTLPFPSRIPASPCLSLTSHLSSHFLSFLSFFLLPSPLLPPSLPFSLLFIFSSCLLSCFLRPHN